MSVFYAANQIASEISALMSTIDDRERRALGARGEALAAEYLEASGYDLVAANFALPVGRNSRNAVIHAEIDIVAYDGPTLCFVEVKTRRSDWFAPPQANVDLRKQRQITRAAQVYRRAFGLSTEPFRFDVVSLVLPEPSARAARPVITLLPNFWTIEKFQKRRWSAQGIYD